MKVRHLFLIPLLVLLAGCSPRMLDVGVAGTVDKVHFTISLPRDLFEFRIKPTDVRQVEVRDWSLLYNQPVAGQPQPQVWLIEAPSCHPSLTDVRYGATPAGFVETVPAQPLREGGAYMVGIEGCHHLHHMGIATFRIVRGRAVEIRWR